MTKFFIVMGLLSFGMLYALTLTTDSNSALSPYFWLIVTIFVVFIFLLCAMIIRYIWQIVRDKHNRVFGSQIARRLSFMFTLMAVLPALALFGVSWQFISHNIKTWFGNDTREALERSLALSKSAVDNAVNNTTSQAIVIRNHVNIAAQQHNLSLALNTTQARQFEQIAIWDISRSKLIQENNPKKLMQPELDSATLTTLRQEQPVQFAEKINETLYASVWLSLPEQNHTQLAVFFRQPIPAKVAEDAELIEFARAKYAELTFAQRGLQTFFLITLFIAATLAILLSLAAALYFARKFVEPILQLATGTQAVAQGDFSQRLAVANQKDELGKLAQQFNHMIEQLAIAKDADEFHRIEQEAARHYLERVLESLRAGVVTLDNSGSLNMHNHSANAIFDVNLAELRGKNWQDWAHLSPQHQILSDTFAAVLNAPDEQETVEISYAGMDETRILSCKAFRLPAENGSGLVLVFDNITDLVMAQKEAAWGEVAKRLAHEIRNPLTPIQLSAERLAWKLHDKLDEPSQQILTKSTDTIVKQVAALKEMVEAFRNYARAPKLKLQEIDLNTLVSEVLVLYESSACTFSSELSNMPMLLKADTTAMRQVLHNLFKNAAEAAESDSEPRVHVKTWRTETTQGFTVQNNGKSFSKHILQHAFEPYITDKPTGTGLGLPVVKKIIEDHGGKITLTNLPENGASVQIEFTLEK